MTIFLAQVAAVVGAVIALQLVVVGAYWCVDALLRAAERRW